MAHASDGVLRRIEDEPFAVPDATFEHVRSCRRCDTRRREIAAAAAVAAGLLSGPRPVPDADRAWDDLQHRLGRDDAGRRMSQPVRVPKRGRRVGRVPLRAAAITGAVALAAAGSAAAATLTDVFSPTRVAPVAVNPGDMRAIASFMSFSNTGSPAGFPTPSGSGTLPFGTLRWDTSGQSGSFASLTQAESAAGEHVSLPAHLPAGVGAPVSYVVQPELTVTMDLDSNAGSLAGTSVVMKVGPAIFVGYGARSAGSQMLTLGILTLPRPAATSTGATIGQIETFLLSRPGVPSGLADEIRLLGNISDVLPVPAPAGTDTKSVKVGRWPAVVISEPSKVASAVIWEDGGGVVHAVAGLLDQKGVLGVADQLG